MPTPSKMQKLVTLLKDRKQHTSPSLKKHYPHVTSYINRLRKLGYIISTLKIDGVYSYRLIRSPKKA